jgi:hypothetical protein
VIVSGNIHRDEVEVNIPRQSPNLKRIIVLVFLHKSFVFLGTEFIFISLISLSVTSTERLAAILEISVLLFSPVGEYNSLIRKI